MDKIMNDLDKLKKLIREHVRNILSEAGSAEFKAVNNKTGKVSSFKSKENMKAAVKSGTHKKFDKPKRQTLSQSDNVKNVIDTFGISSERNKPKVRKTSSGYSINLGSFKPDQVKGWTDQLNSRAKRVPGSSWKFKSNNQAGDREMVDIVVSLPFGKRDQNAPKKSTNQSRVNKIMGKFSSTMSKGAADKNLKALAHSKGMVRNGRLTDNGKLFADRWATNQLVKMGMDRESAKKEIDSGLHDDQYEDIWFNALEKYNPAKAKRWS